MIEAIVLAAGSSTRLGTENKLMLPIGDKPVIAHIVNEVHRSIADHIIVVLGHEHRVVADALKDYPVDIIYNSRHQDGQGSSIASAMSLLRPGSEGFMVCLGDMPMLDAVHYNHIIAAFRDQYERRKKVIVRPTYKGSVGHPVIFDSSFKSEILAAHSPEGCRSIIKAHQDAYCPVDVHELNYFFDIDTKADYRRYLLAHETV